MPIAVALDARGAAAAGEWIRAAAPTYSCLIDEPHVVAELYGMVNVPMAVWIDESGAIVRPAEIAGSSEAFRTDLDRVTFDRTERGLVEASRVREIYSDAVRAWVLEGGWWPKQSEVHQALRIAPAPKGVAIVSEDESNAALAHAAAVRITSADTTKPWRKRLRCCAPATRSRVTSSLFRTAPLSRARRCRRRSRGSLGTSCGRSPSAWSRRSSCSWAHVSFPERRPGPKPDILPPQLRFPTP